MKISEELKKMHKMNFTWETCAKKWNNLLKTYRGIRDNNNSSGRSRQNWEFFELMDSGLGQKASSRPAPDTLMASTISNAPTALPESDIGPSISEEPPKKKTREAAGDEPPNWFKKYLANKKAENEEKRKAAEKRENEKVSAIKELTNAVLALVNKQQ